MSWLDKKITLKVGKEKPKKKKVELTEEQLKKKKMGLKVRIPIYFFDYGLLIYFGLMVFAPEFIGPALGFLTPFMGVMRVLYTIFYTLMNVIMIFTIGVIAVMTYTTKLDDQKKEPTLPDVLNSTSFTYSIIKSMAFIYLTFTLGYGYLAVLLSLGLILGFAYKYMERDFTAKMVKLALAWEEPKRTDPWNLSK